MEEILAEAIGNACFSWSGWEEFVIYRDFDEKEYRYQRPGFLVDDLVEQGEEENVCGARTLGQYLQHAYLFGLDDPCCDYVCVRVERSDHCGQVKDCAFSCVCSH